MFIWIFPRNPLTVSISVDRVGRVMELSYSSFFLSCKCLKFCWPLSSQGDPQPQPPVLLPWRSPLPFKVWNATFHKICTESRLIVRKALAVDLEHSVSINTLETLSLPCCKKSNLETHLGDSGGVQENRRPSPGIARITSDSVPQQASVLNYYYTSNSLHYRAVVKLCVVEPNTDQAQNTEFYTDTKAI